MENASKALLIAGAVLIAVLLISLTMYVFNVITKYTEQSSIQSYSTQAEAFNRYFVYSSNDVDGNRANGVQIKGSEAYNIIAKINDINDDEWAMDEIEVILNGSSISGVPNEENFLSVTAGEGIRKDDKIYTYSYTINSATGLVNRVTLNQF